jgi:hypothetical protein
MNHVNAVAMVNLLSNVQERMQINSEVVMIEMKMPMKCCWYYLFWAMFHLQEIVHDEDNFYDSGQIVAVPVNKYVCVY